MFQAFNIKVSKTVKKGEALKSGKLATVNEREEVGTVTAYVPLMEDIQKAIAGAKQSNLDKDGKTTNPEVLSVDDDGLPVYDSDPANWIFSAVVGAVKMQARNKLISGKADLKDGSSIAIDWAGLCAEGGNNGAALAALRDCNAEFAKYVGTLGKKESTAMTIITMFKNRDALDLQGATMKGKMKDYVTNFALTLSDADQERYDSPLSKVLATCDKVTVDPEDDM